MPQLTLSTAFAEADAADAERQAEHRAYLVGALARVRASSDLRIFVNAVYRHTGHGGAGRWWAVRLRELCGLDAATALQLDPLSEILGCSERQAKRVAGRARELGLVRTRPAGKPEARADWSDRQPGQSWEYQIDWIGVRRLIGLEPAETVPEVPDCPRGQAGPSTGQAGPSTGQAGPSTGQAGPSTAAPQRNKYPGPLPSRVLEIQETRDGTGPGTGAGAIGPPLLDGVTLGQLGDAAELLRLLGLVCELSPIRGLSDCEADRLWWLMAAECALRVGKNPVRYFRWLVQGSANPARRRIPTHADQDRAVARLREACESCRT